MHRLQRAQPNFGNGKILKGPESPVFPLFFFTGVNSPDFGRNHNEEKSWRKRDRWWQKHDGLPKFSLEPHLTIGPTIKTPRLAFWMFFLFILSVEIHCVWGWSWAPIVKSNLSLGFGGCCHWDMGGRGGNQCWRHPPLPPFSPPAFYHPFPPLCLPTLTFFIHSHIFILNLIFSPQFFK